MDCEGRRCLRVEPQLDIEPYSSLVTNTYQVYPDGSGQRWGFPQMPDTQGVFLRKDWLEDQANQAAFRTRKGPAADHLRGVREHPHGRLPRDW